jgi:hypothetical protein
MIVDSSKRYFDQDGVETPLVTTRICDSGESDVWDEESNIYCCHGFEFCELCGTDHRTSNAIREWCKTYGNMVDPDYDYISNWAFKRGNAEMKLLLKWHVEGGGGSNFTIVTQHSYELMERLYKDDQQALATLPKWPPPLKKGVNVIVQGLERKCDLNGKKGKITRYLKKKDKYGIVVTGYKDGTEFAIDGENVVVNKEAPFGLLSGQDNSDHHEVA